MDAPTHKNVKHFLTYFRTFTCAATSSHFLLCLLCTLEGQFIDLLFPFLNLLFNAFNCIGSAQKREASYFTIIIAITE